MNKKSTGMTKWGKVLDSNGIECGAYSTFEYNDSMVKTIYKYLTEYGNEQPYHIIFAALQEDSFYGIKSIDDAMYMLGMLEKLIALKPSNETEAVNLYFKRNAS